jgi:uncharacterized membrane protein
VEFQGSTLVFQHSPFSPSGLLAALAVAGLLLFFGYSTIRMAGWGKGLVLVALRALALLLLGLIMLQPSMIEYERVSLPIPESFNRKEVRVFDPEELKALLPPLALVPPPAGERARDVLVKDVTVPPVAFYKSECAIKAIVHNDGPAQEGEIVVARLTRSGSQPMLKRKVALAEGAQAVALSIVPDSLGEAAYAVSLISFPIDAAPGNNTFPFSLTVARDSVRVLHVAGHPSWDVRFLRQLLVSMPGLELVSFYLLVEAEDFAPHSKEELALIPFPTDELFLKELGNFDLVIVQNFPLGSYFLLGEKHMEKMVRYVEEGGGLLFLGGDKAFALGDVQKTRVAGLLPAPVEVQPPAEPVVRGSLQVRLAPDGLSHPVTTFSPEGWEAPPSLSGLPPLASVNRLGPPVEGAAVLLTAQDGEQTFPLAVARQAGKGRVLVLATDSLWKWAFPSELTHDSPGIYRRLLMNSISWLTGDPRLEEVELRADRVPATEGEETAATVCIKGAAGVGTHASIEAEWLDVSGLTPAFKVQLEAPMTSSRCGPFALPAAKPGAWLVSVEVETEEREYAGRAVVTVQRKKEDRVERLLGAAAPLLDRSYQPFLLDRPFGVDSGRQSLDVDRPRITRLWHHPAFLGPLLALLLAEWLLRRRWGYL